MYYVYLLRCAGGSLYAGITTDPARRFAEHAGLGGRGARYTAAHPPLRMEAVWTASDRSAASALEARLKTLSRPQKERLLSGAAPRGWDLTPYTRIPVSPSGSPEEPGP